MRYINTVNNNNNKFIAIRTKINKKKRKGKKNGKNVRPDRASSGHLTLSLPVKKAPLGRILRNLRLRMRRTYFRTGSLRSRDSRHFQSSMRTVSLPVAPPQIWLSLCPYTTVQLLIPSGGMFSDPLWWNIKTLLFLPYVSMLRTTFVDFDALLQQQSIIDGLIHVMCLIDQFQLHHVIM